MCSLPNCQPDSHIIIILLMAESRQRSIHSVSAKPARSIGRLFRGNLNQDAMNTSHHKSGSMDRQIMKQLEYLPKLKPQKKRAAKSMIQSEKNIQQIIIMESGIFPSVYYRKATLRAVLKEFTFPHNVVALPPKDQRVGLIYQIVLNLFSEITFFAFNILAGEDNITGSIYVFFSDAQTIPYSKCCNLPVYIELCQNGSGRVLCNSHTCESNILAEFLISFDDGKKLWKHIRYFATASHLDQKLRSRISKLINSGRHRRMNLISVVHDTSRQIAELLQRPPTNSDHAPEEEEEGASPFITGAKVDYFRQQDSSQQEKEPMENEDDNIDNELIEQLPYKFMSKTYGQFQSKINQGLVNQGKVFHKDFELIKRIDQQLLDKRRTKNSTAINFPRLMSEFKRDRKKMRVTYRQLDEIKSIVNNSVL